MDRVWTEEEIQEFLDTRKELEEVGQGLLKGIGERGKNLLIAVAARIAEYCAEENGLGLTETLAQLSLKADKKDLTIDAVLNYLYTKILSDILMQSIIKQEEFGKTNQGGV